MLNAIRNFMNDESGNAVEYGLIVALVGVMLVAALTTLQTSISGVFTGAATILDNAIGGN